jgi:hypothetical protein
MLSEGITASDIGHAGLDVAGLVPGLGEGADLANAIWYAKNGEYLSSALSVISMVPEVGDLIGKGTKYLSKFKHFDKLLTKYGPKIEKYWDKALKIIKHSEKLRPFARRLDKALKDALTKTIKR